MGAVVKAVVRLLKAPWFWLMVAAALLSALVWFVGPLIALGENRPLAPPVPRLIVLIGIVLAWGLANLIFRLTQARSNDKMIDEMAKRDLDAERKAEADKSASSEELAAISHRATELLDLLRTARFGKRWRKRYVYQLPWYLVVGPPGSGKTTALLNSGLRFPLAERTGRRLLAGLGGTRNCDWLLTENAVLIDTAGRYTTQDGNPAVESSVWSGFLDLLKRHRPRQPINGVLVVIAPVELARLSEAERAEHAATVRERLLELSERLSVRYPVYVMFSKLDLVLGFSEFFDSLGREERAQVWGSTLAFDDGRDDDGAVADFGTSFDALVSRLERRVVRRLQEEADGRRRARMLDFPAQLATLKPTLQHFLAQVFLTNRFEAKLLLRGFYLTSATQTGAPQDALADVVAPSFAMTGDQLRPPMEPPPALPRACFLQRLLPEVIFAEADLVGADLRLESARRWSGRLVAGGAVAVLLAAVGGWYVSFQNGRTTFEAAVTKSGQISDDHMALRGAQSENETLHDMVTVLDKLRALPAGYGAQHGEQQRPLTLALYDLDPLGNASVEAYRRGLERLLLPDILKRLEAQLAARQTGPDLLYQTLKVYLMVGARGPFDEPLVATWFDIDLQQRLPDDPDLRTAIARHEQALLEILPEKVQLDDAKIAAAREALSDRTLAMRGYDLVKGLPAVKELASWKPIDHIGAAGTKVLLRPSGRSMLDGINGLYTRPGFFDVFLPSSAKIAQAEAQDSWVLGQSDDRKATLAQAERIRQEMVVLYLDDYTRAWDDMATDMVVVPFRSPAQAADSLNILSGPNSPLKTFAGGVAKETDLDTPPPAPPAAQGAVAGAQAKLAAVEAQAQGAASLADQAASQAGASTGAANQLAQATNALKGPPPGHPVTAHFAALKEMVTAPEAGAPAPIDATLKSMGQMYSAFNRLARNPTDPAARAAIMTDLQNATADIQTQATSLPGPFAHVASAVADSGTAVAAGGARAYMDKVWHGGEGPLAACTALVSLRFPFDASSNEDAPPEDFAKVFAPGGALDQFFNTHLKPYVDTSDHPWRWQSADGIQIHLSDEVLSQFERAAEIREAMFAPDGKTPAVRFDISPVKVDERINTVTFDLDGQELIYRHGPIKRSPMQWPGKDPSGAQLSFSPDRDEPATALTREGPWDLVRLLDAGEVSPDTATQYRLHFHIGNRDVTFLARAASIHNLFTVLDQFADFHCPNW